MVALKKNLILFIILFLTCWLFSCNQKTEPDISPSIVTISNTPTPNPETKIASMTENENNSTENQPAVTNIQFPETVQANSDGSIGEIRFSDREGDIYSAQFTCIDCGCMDFEYFAFDPMAVLNSGDVFSGSFQFQQSCMKCDGNQGYDVEMQIQLFDQQGNASLPAEYTFSCIE